jgi:hypothetical protein
MSDYGDDFSDYGDDWLYVEDEYMAADDLAEHAVASPPPTTYGDDEEVTEWDRFDYFNDIEYASDGYDDALFLAHDVKGAKAGEKRKRAVTSSHSRKRRKTTEGAPMPAVVIHSPVVWRSQADRAPKQRMLGRNVQPYALLSDWREKLADTPHWARGAPPKPPSAQLDEEGVISELPTPTADLLDEADMADGEEMDQDEDEGEGEGEGEGEDGPLNISQDVLMAALQRQLSVAGGPLSGMDPQQLLQFAMRMATDQDAGDDIAGEMAKAMLESVEGEEEGDEDEDDKQIEETLMSWVDKQRNTKKDASATEPHSPEAARDSKRPPTPPSSEANRSVKAGVEIKLGEAKSKVWTAKETRPTAASLKRKADEDVDAESTTKTTKKRATRSFDAPTTASQARTTSTRTTRATRAKR